MNDNDEQLLLSLTKAINRVYEKPRKLFWRQFLLGLFSGLGATIGAGIVVGLFGYVLKFIGGLPVVGDWINGISSTIGAK